MFTPSDLEAYLDEALPPEEMARIEKAARDDAALARSLASIHARRDEGIHTLGEIWRGRRLSCPTRHQLGTWLLGTIKEDLARYIAFHVELVGCRYCQANLADLRAQQDVADQIVVTRRHKYFQSSAGYLKTEGGEKGGGRKAEGGGRK
jgi:anti-sigma factor RsiW